MTKIILRKVPDGSFYWGYWGTRRTGFRVTPEPPFVVTTPQGEKIAVTDLKEARATIQARLERSL